MQLSVFEGMHHQQFGQLGTNFPHFVCEVEAELKVSGAYK